MQATPSPLTLSAFVYHNGGLQGILIFPYVSRLVEHYVDVCVCVCVCVSLITSSFPHLDV